MDDDAILKRAAEILTTRQMEKKAAEESEAKRLFKLYGHKWNPEIHDLGKPKKLLPQEALLVAAFERNKYILTISKGENRWIGDAECKHHLRATSMVAFASSRLELLWSLWASVSGQVEDCGELGDAVNPVVHLEEHHFQGSVVQKDLQILNREFRQARRSKGVLLDAADD